MSERNISLFRRICNLYSLSIIFNILNLTVYGLILAASIMKLLKWEPNVLVITCFSGAASLLLIFSEFYITQMVYDFFRFIVTFRGRGALLLIMGFIVFGDDLFNVITTYYTVSIALLYIVISFVPHVLPLNDIRCNLRAYSAYLEELRDPYGVVINTDMMTRTSRPTENALSTLKTNAVRDIHTIRSGPENLVKEQKLERIKSGRAASIKGHATLAMEINAALSELQYSDFASSPENISCASLEHAKPIPPPHRTIPVGSPLGTSVQEEEVNPFAQHFIPIHPTSSLDGDIESLSRNDSSASSSKRPPPIPPVRNPRLHRASRF